MPSVRKFEHLQQRIVELEKALAAERSRSAAAMSHGEAIFQHVMDHAPAVVFMKDVQGRYLAVNHRFLELYDFDYEGVIGQTDDELFPAEIAQVLQANDTKVIEEGQSFQFEEVAFHKDGPHTYLTLKYPAYDAEERVYAVCGIATDITERKVAEEETLQSRLTLRARVAERTAELKESEESFHAIMDNLVDGVITIDERGEITSVNQAVEGIFQYAAGELIGRNVKKLMPEPYHSEHDSYVGHYLHTGEKKIIGIGREALGQRKDGEVFPIDLAVCEFAQGGERFFSGIIRDITQRKHLEEQLLQAQKMESVGRLAGGIAHDFNNQIGIILFDVDMMLNGLSEPDPLHEDLLKIRKVLLRSANLTRQLLVFSRRQPMEMQSLDLNRQVCELQRMLDRLLGVDIAIQVDLADDLATVWADGGNIDQVLINLAINARDAMPEGGVLEIKLQNVVIDAGYCKQHTQARPGPYVQMCISDTGTGMNRKVVQQIFDPFFTTKEVGKGTGLGLSVVYGIVQAHEGWVTVESRVGEGTRFEIYLPALVSAAAEEGDAAPDALEKTGRQERILFVDDEAEFRERIERLLVQQGYQVEICSTAVEARSVCEQRGTDFDLIICDVALPDGRGHELADELAENNPQMQILLITGYADHMADQSLPFLLKPFAVAELLDKVRQLLP